MHTTRTTNTTEKTASSKTETIIIKKVRPWVKVSLVVSMLGLSYGFAR